MAFGFVSLLNPVEASMWRTINVDTSLTQLSHWDTVISGSHTGKPAFWNTQYPEVGENGWCDYWFGNGYGYVNYNRYNGAWWGDKETVWGATSWCQGFNFIWESQHGYNWVVYPSLDIPQRLTVTMKQEDGYADWDGDFTFFVEAWGIFTEPQLIGVHYVDYFEIMWAHGKYGYSMRATDGQGNYWAYYKNGVAQGVTYLPDDEVVTRVYDVDQAIRNFAPYVDLSKAYVTLLSVGVEGANGGARGCFYDVKLEAFY